MTEFNIDEIIEIVRICLQSICLQSNFVGSKKMQIENDAFKVTAYQMGNISNIRIDMKEV